MSTINLQSPVTVTSEAFDMLLDASFAIGMSLPTFQGPVTVLMVSLLPELDGVKTSDPTVTIPLSQAMLLAKLGSAWLSAGLMVCPEAAEHPKVKALESALVTMRDALFTTADGEGCDMSPVEYMRPQ